MDTRSSLRLLVVEDEALLAEEIRDRLTRNGYHVMDIADTAAGAMEAARQLRPDLILMDIRLKGQIDGIEAASQIYEQLGIPAIFLTAHSDRATLDRARNPAQFGYLLKPIREHDLLVAIEMAIHRHGTERQLRESQLSDAAIFESAADAVLALDRQGRIWRWNPAAELLFGYDNAEVKGRHISILSPRGQDGETAALLARLWSGHPIPSHATVRIKKDGLPVHVSLSISPVKDFEGNAVGAVGVLRDISEQKRAEEMLRASEARLEAVVEGMPVLLIAIDDGGQFLAWNSECERVTGYSAPEIVRNPLAPGLLYPDKNYREQMLEDVRLPGDDHSGHAWKITCKDGSIRTIEWSSMSRRFPISGWPHWTIGVDITDRIKLEEDLRQAHKMQALGQLAGGVAHDFNNLLTVINGYASMVHQSLNGQPDIQRRVGQICQAGETAAAITDQLLSFSQKRVSEPGAVDLNEAIRAFAPILESLVGSAVSLHFDLDPDLRAILATETGIQTILLNLTSNARDAMPDGGRLSIQTRSVTRYKPGKDSRNSHRLYNVLRVQDTGVGIPPEITGRIFDPFFTTKPTGKGAGLGLATVYGIVSQRGGWIHVDSLPGKGTTFEVYLPSAGESPSQPVSETTARPGTAAMSGTCLVVDDQPAVRELTADFLRSHGLTVLEACDGPSALEASSNHAGAIELLVCDLVMPGMPGSEVAARIQKERPDMPVLFITGYAHDAAKLSAGANVLAKPFSAEQLITAVTSLLAGKRTRTESERPAFPSSLNPGSIV